jgi:hypothetical protein
MTTKAEDLFQTLRYLVVEEGDEDLLAEAIEIAMMKDPAAPVATIARLFWFMQEGG